MSIAVDETAQARREIHAEPLALQAEDRPDASIDAPSPSSAGPEFCSRLETVRQRQQSMVAAIPELVPYARITPVATLSGGGALQVSATNPDRRASHRGGRSRARG